MSAIGYTFKDTYLGKTVIWTPVTEADTFVAFQASGYADKSVQVTGTMGSATVLLKGSNDGTNYAGLTDPQGNAISFTTNTVIKQIEEATLWIQPTHSGGSSESVTVTVFMVKK